EIFEKIVCTFVPVVVMTATHTSAMSATSNAYSRRSWPEVPRSSARKRAMKFIRSLSLGGFGLPEPHTPMFRKRSARMWRDRDHGCHQRNGCATSATGACERGLKCRCHSKLTGICGACPLRGSTLLDITLDLQLRNRTIDSVPAGCVLLRDEAMSHAA